MKTKKKIGIFTLLSENYGNRLQNYAVQTVLKQYFEIVETINVESIPYLVESFKKIHGNIRFLSFLYPFLLKTKTMIKLIRDKKKKNFAIFDKRIAFSKKSVYISVHGYSKNIEHQYDAFCAGSDQIWNVQWKTLCSINSFLPFKNDCKISLSASFGVDDIERSGDIARWLKDFKALSVREEAGAKIIKKVCGRDAAVLIDPVLMLSSEEWNAIAKKPKKMNDGPYVLTYFLSPMCDKAKVLFDKLKKNYAVVSLNDEKDLIAKYAGPSEFVYLFRNASLVLTDSYHACIFSFLFDKPFLVYDRNWTNSKMNSRLITFFDKFHLERKYAESKTLNDLWEHDYRESYELLKDERKKAFDFLDSCFD